MGDVLKKLKETEQKPNLNVNKGTPPAPVVKEPKVPTLVGGGGDLVGKVKEFHDHHFKGR